MVDSESGPLDERGHSFKRRSGDAKLQIVADSSLLKIGQYVITAIALPALGFGMNMILDKLTKFEDSINKANTTAATVELRLSNTERSNLDRDSQLRLLTEATVRHEYEIRSLKEMSLKMQSVK